MVEKTAEKPAVKVLYGRDPFEGLKLEDCKPFVSREELPEADVKIESWKNSEGHVMSKRRVASGEPRFLLEQCPSRWLNLIGIYRNGKGVARKNVRTLKPTKDTNGLNPMMVAHIKEDKRIFEQLKKQKIPVYAAGQLP